MVVRCRNCDQEGHASNADRFCPYFRRDPECHRDAELGDCVPHMSQLEIRVFADGVEQVAARGAVLALGQRAQGLRQRRGL